MKNLEEARLDRLTSEINFYFDTRDPYVVPRGEPQIEQHLLEMFEVVSVRGRELNLTCWFNGNSYDVTLGEERIARYLRPGDIFLMAIVRRGKKWRVWHMSPPYKSVGVEAESFFSDPCSREPNSAG